MRLVLPALCIWAVDIIGAYGGYRSVSGVLIGALICVVIFIRREHRNRLLLACVVAVLCSGISLLPRLIMSDQSTLTSLTSGKSAATAHTVTGRIASKPQHGLTGTYLTVRTAYGDMTVYAKGQQWDNLVLGQRITAVMKLDQRPENHFTQGEWRAIYLRESQPPHGIWAFSAYASRKWEEALTHADATGLTPSLHALARGMSIGDTSGLSPEYKDNYRASGLTYLTAVSGANVSYVLLLAGIFLRHSSPRRKSIVSALLLILFAALVGPEPAVLRATISGAVGVLALWKGGRSSAFPALGAGIMTLLILSPSFAVSPGFALSVVATAALIWGAPQLSHCLHALKVPAVISDTLAVTVVASVSTMPVSLYFFGTASTFGILANILVAPVVPFITAMGLVGVVVCVVCPLLGGLVVIPSIPLLWWVEKIGVLLGSSPWAQIDLASHDIFQISPAVPAFVAVALIATIVLSFSSRRGRIFIAGMVTLALIATGIHAGCTYHRLTQCRVQDGAVTLNVEKNGVLHAALATPHTSAHSQQSPHSARTVIVVKEKLTAASLPHLENIAHAPGNPLFVHVASTQEHPFAPRSHARSAGKYNRQEGMSPTISFTPQGTPIVEIPLGTVATVTPTNKICQTNMAR